MKSDDWTIKVRNDNGKWTVRVNWTNAAIGIVILACAFELLMELLG